MAIKDITCDWVAPNAYGVAVKGNSMAPKYEDGDFVVASPDCAVTSGDSVILKTSSGDLFLTRIRFKGEHALLEPINPVHPSVILNMKEILFFHKITWCKPKVRDTLEDNILKH